MELDESIEILTDSFQNEDFVNFLYSPPTLQDIAIIPIIVKFWTEPEVMKEIYYACNYRRYDPDETTILKLEKGVLDKLNKCSLPDLFKAKISEFIRPVGAQLFRWHDKKYQEYCSLHDLRVLGGSIYWTMEGVIDKVKILDELIRRENTNNINCCLFELACKYCLEKHIFDLWEKMPPERKNELDYIYTYSNHYTDIIAYWTLVVKNELYKMWHVIGRNVGNIYDRSFSLNQNMISWSIYIGNPFALKYFWKKLTVKEKDDKIQMWLSATAMKSYSESSNYKYLEYNSYADMLCFLLFRSKYQNKTNSFFLPNFSETLKTIYSSWPFQNVFVQATLLLMDYINECTYLSIIKDISSNMEKRSTTGKLFNEIWSASPPKLKQAFLQEDTTNIVIKFPVSSVLVRAILKLLEIGDLNTALMIVKDVSTSKKEWIVKVVPYSESFCNYVYHKNDLRLLDVLFKHLLPSDVDLLSLKQEMMLSYTKLGVCFQWIMEGDFQAVDEFFKWALQSENEIENFKKQNLNPYGIANAIRRDISIYKVDGFLNWYYETEEAIKEFKSALPFPFRDPSKVWNNEIGIPPFRQRILDKIRSHTWSPTPT